MLPPPIPSPDLRVRRKIKFHFPLDANKNVEFKTKKLICFVKLGKMETFLCEFRIWVSLLNIKINESRFIRFRISWSFFDMLCILPGQLWAIVLVTMSVLPSYRAHHPHLDPAIHQFPIVAKTVQGPVHFKPASAVGTAEFRHPVLYGGQCIVCLKLQIRFHVNWLMYPEVWTDEMSATVVQ